MYVHVCSRSEYSRILWYVPIHICVRYNARVHLALYAHAHRLCELISCIHSNECYAVQKDDVMTDKY